MRVRLLLCLAVIGLLQVSCVRSIGSAPPRLMQAAVPEAACDGDPRILGRWKASSTSQLGPATMKSTLRCDCTYKIRLRVFGFLVLKESGPFRVEQGEIIYGRVQRKDEDSYFETRYPYSFDGERLVFDETDGSVTRFRLLDDEVCAVRSNGRESISVGVP